VSVGVQVGVEDCGRCDGCELGSGDGSAEGMAVGPSDADGSSEGTKEGISVCWIQSDCGVTKEEQAAVLPVLPILLLLLLLV